MTILEAMNRMDAREHNVCPREQKVQWLGQLDALVMEDVIRTHEGGITTAFRAYDGDTPLDTRLLVPAPFEEMYLHYMLAQLHYHNGEYDRYNRAMEQFRAVWDAFVNFYNRTHTPLGQRYRYF